jgi:hypothetical protein
VSEWERLNGYGVVFKNDRMLGRVNAMKMYGVVHPFAEEVYLWLHQCLQCIVGIDVQRCGAPQQPECRYESHQPETMVAMQVRNEDVVYEREMYVSSAQLQLCAFSTVYHEQFVPDFYNLGTWVVSCCRQGRATAQYMYFERFHSTANLVIRYKKNKY